MWFQTDAGPRFILLHSVYFGTGLIGIQTIQTMVVDGCEKSLWQVKCSHCFTNDLGEKR